MLEVDSVSSHNADSFLDYTHRRELGKISKCEHQRISNGLTARHTLKPLVADTPVNCRSTYLLRLNATGELVAAAHGDRSVGIYCASSGQLYARCIGHQRSPWTLAFHPSQPYLLASGCLGGSIRLWNLENLFVLNAPNRHNACDIKCNYVWRHSGAIASLAFHPIHPILVAAWTQEVVFYDWVSGRMLSVWRFVSFQSRVRWVKFAPDGGLLYTATTNPSSYSESASNHLKSTHELTPNSPSKTCDSSILTSISNCTNKVPDHCISRDLLLEFLVRRSDSWFHNLGICIVCSIRLCRWAGTLGPKFPLMATDIHVGMSIACQAAAIAAATLSITNSTLSNVIRELLEYETCKERSEVYERISHDANPAAVAIIEDMPAHEFLLSRGNYCQTPKATVFGDGICCGGHACDLVIMHRELMRHSLCRPCLSAFWMWASKHVSWWCWSTPSTLLSSKSIPSGDHVQTKSENIDSLSRNVEVCTNPNTIDDEKLICTQSNFDDSVGICIQCRAKMSVQYRTNLPDSFTQNKPISNETKVSIEDSENIMVERRNHKFNQSLVPLAALDLLRSRLSNAYEVTPITYIASDLIAEGILTDTFRMLLLSDVKHTYPDLPEFIMKFNEWQTNDSPCAKRRRITGHLPLENQNLGGFSSNQCQTNESYSGDPALMINNSSSCHSLHTFYLAQEALQLGLYMRNSTSHHWNYAQPVIIRTPTSDISNHNSVLFPYVSIGSRLLRPSLTSMTSKLDMADSNNRLKNTLSSNSCSSLRTTDNGVDECQSYDVPEIHNETFVTACCRCGHIVPRTFPVDPDSSLSAVVCETLVLSEGQYSVSAKRLENKINYSSQASSSSTNVSPNSFVYSNEPSSSLTNPSSSSSTLKVDLMKDQTERSSRGSGNIFYLVDQTSGNSMLNVVNRSITEVITGLFVDMGEYGSANSLQDSTHRICRWELSLCRPVENVGFSYAGSSTFDRSYLPMPTNIAVSYNSNSLVVSHARLFNDSSICLSPDGRMLAAFVVPRLSGNRSQDNISKNKTSTSSQNHSTTVYETILAVYRLQPKQNRGQCLFARRFVETSPVCLDFSPLGEFLAVGLATTRMPSESYSSMRPSSGDRDFINYRNATPNTGTSNFISGVPCLCENHASIACLFRLERSLKSNSCHSINRNLRNTINIKHPGLLNPVSSRYYDDMVSSVSNLDRWHRLLLSTPNGLSLNTIVWNHNGNILYGTTKGLIVIMQGQSPSIMSVPSINHCTKSTINVGQEQQEASKKHSSVDTNSYNTSESGILTVE